MDAQGLQVWASSTIMIGPGCVGTCQVQESVLTHLLPSVECRAILFHVFYEKPIIITIR